MTKQNYLWWNPTCNFFVVRCSKVLLLCRYLPWRPGVLNLVSFTWVSRRIGVSPDTKCFHFGAFYVAWGILWPEETFLWQQIRPPPHQETSVTHCYIAELNSDHNDQGKDGFKAGQKLFPTLNCKCINPLQVDLNASVDTNHWHMAAQDLLQGFLILHNNLPA